MRLEGFASLGDADAVQLPVEVYRKEGRYILDTTKIVAGVVDALERRGSKEDIAAASQAALAKGIAEMANLCIQDLGPDAVACSGGVMYNEHMVSVMEKNLDRKLLRHVFLPPGDGCISLGQVAAAKREMKR